MVSQEVSMRTLKLIGTTMDVLTCLRSGFSALAWSRCDAAILKDPLCRSITMLYKGAIWLIYRFSRCPTEKLFMFFTWCHFIWYQLRPQKFSYKKTQHCTSLVSRLYRQHVWERPVLWPCGHKAQCGDRCLGRARFHAFWLWSRSHGWAFGLTILCEEMAAGKNSPPPILTVQKVKIFPEIDMRNESVRGLTASQRNHRSTIQGKCWTRMHLQKLISLQVSQ